MVGLFVALASGQLLIGQVALETFEPFNIVVAFFALALIMVSMTRAEPPQVTAS